MRRKSFNKGFTLIELAIALAMIGILMSAGIGIFSTTHQFNKAQTVQQQLQDVKQSLLVYLKINGYLPCPDDLAEPDGKEDRRIRSGVSVCRYEEGVLPYVTLGIEGRDPWYQFFYYRVNKRSLQSGRVVDICEAASVFGVSGEKDTPNTFGRCRLTGVSYCRDCSDACESGCDFGEEADPRTKSAPPYFHLATRPISSDTAALETLNVSSLEGNQLDERAVVMVVSFGENGAQTWADRHHCPNDLLGDEKENCDNDRDFVQGQKQTLDDYLIWINLNEAKQAMLETGRFK